MNFGADRLIKSSTGNMVNRVRAVANKTMVDYGAHNYSIMTFIHYQLQYLTSNSKSS